MVTGWLTVSDALPVTPSTMAAIVALPAAVAVTTPSELTDAVPLPELTTHEMARPVMTVPVAERATALACEVWPMLSVVGFTETLTELTVGGRTGAVTVIDVLPVFPSLVARMVEVPAATAATVPEALIVAIDGMELDQAMVRPVRTLPCASVSVTTACD